MNFRDVSRGFSGKKFEKLGESIEEVWVSLVEAYKISKLKDVQVLLTGRSLGKSSVKETSRDLSPEARYASAALNSSDRRFLRLLGRVGRRRGVSGDVWAGGHRDGVKAVSEMETRNR